VAKYRVNELLHARWAMLATAGAIIPEGLQANGSNIVGGTWWETGSKMLGGGTLNWSVAPFGVIPNPLPLFAVAAVNVALMAAAEGYRAKGEGPAGYSPGIGKFDSSIFSGLDPLYPGGPFDPLVRRGAGRLATEATCGCACLLSVGVALRMGWPESYPLPLHNLLLHTHPPQGLADDPEVFQELQVKEIKNGRVAMVGMLGFAVQAAVTGEGPYANWSKHVADPFGYNLLTVLGAGEDRVPTL
jgi:light-harvesting complex II chlorophyll a/b binding protein 5